MYADREEAVTHRSVKERLRGNSGSAVSSNRRGPISGKRSREDDDKWEHDLFDSNEPQASNNRVGPRDLRLKLQRRSIDQATQIVRGSASGGVRDLREKLSGTMHPRPAESKLPPLRPTTVRDATKPPRNSEVSEAPVAETKKIASTITKRKSQPKVETVDSFLQSLGLEKYSITFQAEEVDMAALVHMGDEDLKAMGIPMGPRKKILSALESKV